MAGFPKPLLRALAGALRSRDDLPVPAKDEEPKPGPLAPYLRYSHVGLQFFLAVAMFTGGGIWLDRRLGTVVLFTLLGLVLGFGGGLYTLYREFILRKASSSRGDATAERGPDRPNPPSEST